VAAALILSIMRAAAFFNAAINSSKHLHNSMLSAVLRAPILFFDTNPIGRILNRFSRDIGIMDELLPEMFLEAVQIVLFCIGAVVLPSILNPWIILPATPLIIIFILIGRYYLTTARDVRRLEGISRSPVLSHFSDSLMGLVTIRAYKREDAFLETLYRFDFIFFAFVKHMHLDCALVSLHFFRLCKTYALGLRARLRIVRSGFEYWPGKLCCVLWKNTLYHRY